MSNAAGNEEADPGPVVEDGGGPPTETAAPKSGSRRKGWWRRSVVATLVALACLTFLAAVPGVWARRNFLDTDRFVDRAAPLVDDPAVQAALTARLTDQLMTVVDPRSLFEEVLPERGRLLAVPLTNAVEGFVADRVARFVDSDAFANLWRRALETAHGTAENVLRGDSDVVTASDGEVTLNLLPIVDAVLRDLTDSSPEILGREVDLPDIQVEDLPAEAVERLEDALGVQLDDDFGQVTVYDDGKLAAAQDGIRLFDQSVIGLFVVSIASAATALWISRRRRRTLLQLCFGVVLGMVLLRRLGFALRDEVGALPPTENGRDAATVVVDAFLDPLLLFAAWAIAVAAVVAVVAAVTGPYGWATSLRRRARELWTGLTTRGQTSKAPAIEWVRAHRDAALLAGAAFGVVLLWATELSWLGLLLVLAVVATFEAVVYRMGAEPEPA